MTWQEKYEWLRVKLPSTRNKFSYLVEIARSRSLISKEQCNKINSLYKSCPSESLDCDSVLNEQFGNKTILAVNLLYKLVKDHDNLREI